MQELSATMEQVHIVKSIENTTKNTRRIRLIRHFPMSINHNIRNCSFRAKKAYSKLPNSKDILAELVKLQEKRIPSCKSILPQNLLWTSFTRYEKIMEFI